MTDRNQHPSDLPDSKPIPPSNLRFRFSAPARRAFTLIEMITVLTIMIIILSLAVPVWNALLGGTNLTTAQNTISAMLANARADAIYNRQTIGVLFFIDPKTQQTAMAEVQVQTLYQPATNAYSGLAGYTSLFNPGWWNGASFTPYSGPGYNANNGPVNSLELVNNPDSNTPGNVAFYRDTVILAKGVGVALNNNTYTYNQNLSWLKNPSNLNPIDRYVRLGCIMFNPDGTLASIPFGIPYYEWFTAPSGGAPPTPSNATENQICKAIGMPQYFDTASLYSPPAGSQQVPLMSSVGLIVYDNDVYLSQHANPMTVTVNGQASQTTQIGDGSPFTAADMNYSLQPTPAFSPALNTPQAQDKFVEENWIDQNGTALLVSPFNGSLIKAK